MWRIKKHFQNYSSQQKVAKFLLETGLKVKDGKIYCNEILMSPVRISRVLDVDRRTVNATIKTIQENEELYNIYSNLKTTAFFGEVAREIDAGLIEIIPTSAEEPGIIAGVTQILADLDVIVRQCITREIEFHEKAKIFITTDTSVPMEAVERIKEIKGVKSVTIY
ncbi:MAG: hypothetical protein KGY76_00145 [Candidatus Thermoplasmatota archaeon]|nr:hypothetical protein [Candidatus Thermoplasmatota archaeon]